jgi:hypothetical protein
MLNISDFFSYTIFWKFCSFYGNFLRLLPSDLSSFPSEKSVILFAK